MALVAEKIISKVLNGMNPVHKRKKRALTATPLPSSIKLASSHEDRKHKGTNYLRESTAPAAKVFKLRRNIGLSNIENLRISYTVGEIYVGNGTLGATDNVYFRDRTDTFLASRTTGVGQQIPIAPGDSYFGAAYMIDLFKHFQEVEYHSIDLYATPVIPSTANSCEVFLAPFRGPTGICSLTTGTPAPVNFLQLMSVNGVKSGSSFEPIHLPLTPSIMAGYGPKSNRFNIHDGYPNTTVNGSVTNAGLGSIPCTFAVAGVNTGSDGLRGKQTHILQVELNISLRNWVGEYDSGDLASRPVPPPPLRNEATFAVPDSGKLIFHSSPPSGQNYFLTARARGTVANFPLPIRDDSKEIEVPVSLVQDEKSHPEKQFSGVADTYVSRSNSQTVSPSPQNSNNKPIQPVSGKNGQVVAMVIDDYCHVSAPLDPPTLKRSGGGNQVVR